jgi:hypothetical protein
MNSSPQIHRTKYQKFDAVEIQRSAITGAAYNPRQINAHAKKKLRENLKKRGLLDTLVWNKRTGNLVSGHQRLSILDALEGKQEYTLTVAQVDLSDQEEKEQNIFFNNQQSMGTWDLDGLSKLLPDIDLDNTGFEKFDLQLIFDTTELPDLGEKNTGKILMQDSEPAQHTQEELRKIKESKKNARENFKALDDAEFYVVVVFRHRIEKEEFLARLKIDKDERYVSGDVMRSCVWPDA